MDASSYDNPAGRLHALLQRLNEFDGGTAIIEAWKVALRASDEDVQSRLGEVSGLVKDLRAAVEESGSAGHAAQVARYSADWQRAIFPLDRPFSNPVQEVRPQDVSLEALQSVAEYLHRVAPEGRPVEDGKLDDLRSQIEELIEEVRASVELDEDIKQLIVARLRDVLRALDHVDIGGPKAVKLATESLAGAIDLAGWQTPSVFSSAVAKKVAVLMTSLWFVFGLPAAVQIDSAGWDRTIRELMPAPPAQIAGSHQAEPPRPTPPSPPEVLAPRADGGSG